MAEHLRGLRKDEISAAIALPTSTEQEKELVLSLLNIFERVLRDAHSWCFEGRNSGLHGHGSSPLTTSTMSPLPQAGGG